MSIILYGIPNCDTIKKARKWLESHGINHVFHDFREQGLTPQMVAGWSEQVGWEVLMNRRSTTWRQLDDADRADLNAETAMALMLRQPTLIKRPVLAHHGTITVGFNPASYEALFRDAKPG